MSSLRLPLLPKLIFPLALSAAERPKLDRALAERQLSSRLSKQTLHFYPYLWANIHTDRQANTCVCKHNWKGERQSSPWHPQAALPENSFYLSSTPSYALQLILVVSACVASLPSVLKCVLVRWECLGMFLLDDTSIYLRESLCLDCTLQELMPLVTLPINVVNICSRFLNTKLAFAGRVYTLKEQLIMSVLDNHCKSYSVQYANEWNLTLVQSYTCTVRGKKRN